MESVFSTNIIYALVAIGFLLFGGYIFYEYSRVKKKSADKQISKSSELTELDKVKELQLIKEIRKPASVQERQQIFEKAYQRKYPEAYKEYSSQKEEFLTQYTTPSAPALSQEKHPKPQPIIVEVEEEPTVADVPESIFHQDRYQETYKADKDDFNEAEFLNSEEYKSREKPKPVNPLSIKKNILSRKFSESEELHLANMIKTTKQIYNS